MTTLGSAMAVTAAQSDTTEVLWYKQPAIVTNALVPFGYAANLPGKPGTQAELSWESQTLPVGNGRVGGTVFGGDKLDRCGCEMHHIADSLTADA